MLVGLRGIVKTRCSLVRLVRVDVRVEGYALDEVLKLPQIVDVTHVCFGALNWKANLILNELEGLTVVRVGLKDEQPEEVTVIEVLLKGLLVGDLFAALINFTLNCLQVHTLLVHLSTIDELLNASYGHETIDYNILLLAYSVAPIHSLVVIRRVPVWVENYCSVGTSQVKTEATDLRREQPAKLAWIVVKVLANGLSTGNFSVTIDTEVGEFTSVFFVLSNKHL